MGHVRNYTMGDVVARLKRAQGFNVLHPMGWDAFGLPAENAAIQKGVHPAAWTYANIAEMRDQMKAIGCSLDWSREIATCDPAYYRHEQAMFLDMLERGLVYRKESWVNWDPVDQTVLANEQVIDGRGWRSGAVVERRKLSQWFFRITAFAEELLGALDGLERWPEKVRLMQRNWIGKSTGARVRFAPGRSRRMRSRCSPPGPTRCSARRSWRSPRTIRSATALARENPGPGRVRRRLPARRHQRGRDRDPGEARLRHRALLPPPVRRRTGCLPVYVANFVLMDYGTGAIFGCPAHDQRDLDFAATLRSAGAAGRAAAGCGPGDLRRRRQRPMSATGRLFRSRFLDGLDVEAAQAPGDRGARARSAAGSGETTWRLRDWGVSRQRYWGCPIPVIHCARLRRRAGAARAAAGRAARRRRLLAAGQPARPSPDLEHVACPRCGGPARRETDTFDTFMESSWYFARFADADADDAAVRTRGGRLLAAGRPVYRRRRARRAAPALRPLLHPGDGASAAISISPSRSPACSPRA